MKEVTNKNNKQEGSFTDFALEVINELVAENRFSTAHVYRYALASITSAIGGGELFWGGINRSSLARYEAHLKQKQKSYNTISTYLRVLRALYNRAVDRGIIAGEFRMFANLSTGVTAERKLALTAVQVQQLINKDSARCLSSTVRRAQDFLRLMLFLQGMPYTDLAHLRKVDLKGDLLVSRRQKTGTELCVRIMPEAMNLINRYRNRDETSPYLLNILSGQGSPEVSFYEYRSCLRKLNASLNLLQKSCGMQGVRVSSYTARHTWATIAKYCMVPEEVISEGLGHSSMEVTRTYLKSFEADELNQANRIVNDYIESGRKIYWNSSKMGLLRK